LASKLPIEDADKRFKEEEELSFTEQTLLKNAKIKIEIF
jgi:hypothetical protein